MVFLVYPDVLTLAKINAPNVLNAKRPLKSFSGSNSEESIIVRKAGRHQVMFKCLAVAAKLNSSTDVELATPIIGVAT